MQIISTTVQLAVKVGDPTMLKQGTPDNLKGVAEYNTEDK